MCHGLTTNGVAFQSKSSIQVRPRIDKYDVAIFYGLAQGLRSVFEFQRRTARAIYIDLGYWGRRKRTRWDGYHKVVLNNRHPTAYFQKRHHDSSRFDRHDVEIMPWRKSGKHILIAGMSNKAAAQEGFQPHQWERETIAKLKRITDRPIIYRPKPNWIGAKPLPGSLFGRHQSLEESLRNCHAVVTHHSNVAVDSILAGVPAICPFGVASTISSHRLEDIENPILHDDRHQWAWDIAWTQWSIDEMRDGSCWKYLVEEGLVP